jgi:hypothetical protein
LLASYSGRMVSFFDELAVRSCAGSGMPRP